MPLRERERFLKLSDCEVDDCGPGETGWLRCWETEDGAIFDMTTDPRATLEAIKVWAERNEEIGDFYVETDGKKFVIMQDGKPMPFDKVMSIINNFR